jgi:hypothetical protein
MPALSLPDLAAVLQKLVESVPLGIPRATQTEWDAVLESKKFWSREMARLLGVDVANLPPRPLPPPDPIEAMRRDAAKARGLLTTRLDELQNADFRAESQDDVLVLEDKYRAVTKVIESTDEMLQWIRSKTERTAELQEGEGVANLAREIRQFAEREETSAPSCTVIQKDLIGASGRLDPHYTEARNRAARYCIESWDEADAYMHVIEDDDLAAELWLDAWRATLDYVSLSLFPAELLREELMKRLAATRKERTSDECPSDSLAGSDTDGPICNPRPTFRFRLDGRIWDIRYDGEGGQFPDIKGFKYIAALLAKKNKQISALELMGKNRDFQKIEYTEQPAVDEEWFLSIKERMEELQEEFANAELNEDDARFKEAEREREELLDYVKSAKGFRGKARSIGPDSPAKKAADAVRKALTRAYEQLSNSMPNLEQHLRASLKPEGETYAYYPTDPDPSWEF